MPGIYGVVDFSRDRLNVQRDIGLAMKHEPWYVHERWVGSQALLGRVHQGILSPERQPASNHDGTLQLVLHGYIVDLDHHVSWLEQQGKSTHQWSPSLVALWLYQILGERFIERLNGSFALAIWDGIHSRLLLFTDRFGSRPIYFIQSCQKLLFASEIKCLLLNDSVVDRGVDLRSVASLLTFGTVIGDRTLFQNISKLSFGTVLEFNKEGVKIRRFWDFIYKEDPAKSTVQDYADELRRLLRQAVRRCLQTNCKVGLALSGGLDSRIVAGFLTQELGQGFHTYSFGRQHCSDLAYASRVARALGSCHHSFLTHGEYVYENADESLLLTEGMLDLLDTQATILAKNAQRSDVSIILTGFMADLLWGGSYISNRVLNWKLRGREFVDVLHDRFAFFMPVDVQKKIFRPNIWAQVEGSTREEVARVLADCKANEDGNRADYVFLRTRVQHFTLMANLILLTRRFEYQIPTIDNDLLDYSLSLPVDMRLEYRVYSKAMIEQFPILARIPRTGTGLPLILSQGRLRMRRFSDRLCDSLDYRLRKYSGGKVILPRPNRDWHDLESWSRTTLRYYIESILLSDRCLSRPLFRPEALRQLVSDHMNKKIHGAFWLSPLLTLELWHQTFLD